MQVPYLKKVQVRQRQFVHCLHNHWGTLIEVHSELMSSEVSSISYLWNAIIEFLGTCWYCGLHGDAETRRRIRAATIDKHPSRVSRHRSICVKRQERSLGFQSFEIAGWHLEVSIQHKLFELCRKMLREYEQPVGMLICKRLVGRYLQDTWLLIPFFVFAHSILN